jgi:hypothetical protein
LTEGIIATEVAEKQKASGQYIINSDIAQSSKKITSTCLGEFLQLAPSKDFRKLLENKINKLLAS